MTKLRFRFTILLTIIAIVLIGLNHVSNEQSPISDEYLKTSPTYQSQSMVTLSYEPTGLLGYKLIAEEVKYFSEPKDTWFTKPVMTIYDEDINETWVISSLEAKLTDDRRLFLVGDVKVNNLSTDSQIRQITTKEALVDLVSQNISSENQVNILGPQIQTQGMKLKGNLRNKTAELIDDVKTVYTPNITNRFGNEKP